MILAAELAVAARGGAAQRPWPGLEARRSTSSWLRQKVCHRPLATPERRAATATATAAAAPRRQRRTTAQESLEHAPLPP